MGMSRRGAVLLLSVAGTATVAVGWLAQTGGAMSAGQAGLQSAAIGAGPAIPAVQRPQLTRLQIDLFELHCSADQLLRLDLMELGRNGNTPMAAPPEEILTRLNLLGHARLAVRYDNFVDIASGTRLVSGVSVPTVNQVATTGTGVVVPAVNYEPLGFAISVKGSWLDETQPNLGYIDFAVENSGLSGQQMDLGLVGEGAGIKLPVYQQFKSTQTVVARQGLPVLLACNDLSKSPMEGDVVPVLIARLVATRLIE